MKQMAIKLLFFFVAGMITLSAVAQVRIGGQNDPTPGSVLDLDAGGEAGYYVGGVKLPNISLSDTLVIPAIFTDKLTLAPASLSGMIVYNTNIVVAQKLFPGVYAWTGSKWISAGYGSNLATNNAWSLRGNTGTNPNPSNGPNSNYIGTTDNQDLAFRTSNTEKMRITSNGYMGIGNTAPTNKLHVTAASNPVRIEGLAMIPTTSTQNHNLVIESDGTVYKKNIPNIGTPTQIVVSAGFSDAQASFTNYIDLQGSTAEIGKLIFSTERFDPTNSYNTTTGVFTAPYTGYYQFMATLTLYNSISKDFTTSTLRLGISRAGVLQPTGNASFSSLNQLFGSTKATAVPQVIPYTGIQRLNAGDQVVFATRYVKPTELTLNVAAIGYILSECCFMTISYVGN